MSLPKSVDVVIVGAGPAGHTLALSLHQSGCQDILVVDGQHRTANTSRAAALHAATVEALERLGLADRFVAKGRQMQSTTIWTKGFSPIASAGFRSLAKNTKYPFILGIPQHVSEQILSDAAKERGIIVHRPLRVVDLKPHAHDNTLTDVIFENGETIRARAVVGADGSRSTVRSICGVEWNDPHGEVNANVVDDSAAAANMIVADVTLTAPPSLRPDAINLVIAPEGQQNALMIQYLPGDPYPDAVPAGTPVYRIASGIPAALGPPPRAPEVAYLQGLLDAFGPQHAVDGAAPLEVEHALWSSRFRTHSGIAGAFLTSAPGGAGPVCLLGDAAHIHPPMGGQGMNLGMRDAAKLGPVLARYVQAAKGGEAGATAAARADVEAWATQRRKRALEVIDLVRTIQSRLWVPNKTEYIFGVLPYNPAWIQFSVLSTLTSFEWFRSKTAWAVSGLGDP
ncbi:FAD/NAD(P)-binding domain-containing protein [Epithele typhae]|uniref:FAD/NAD(P)-binding domain-containing protein n=1 Tax=Epithele typhae TaxID=378194 RepID=UPI0020082F10|nr:FAD/NAD(P)-binding domain-containing protein [Epithele typhae]KAH9928522.1 FAD/NAD(P)-binding domain-containing protein [Epithele typhae]